MSEPASYILTYHSLDTTGSPISIAPERFRQHMACLQERGMRVVPLSEVRKVPGSVALTFDDGFRNFYRYAMPILNDFGFPATVFVVSGYCGRNNNWPTQPSGFPVLDLMDWRELCEISQLGVKLGAHTVTHPRLTALREAEILGELTENRKEIEDRTGKAVDSFAYPYGDVDDVVHRIVRQHFPISCSTYLGWVDSNCTGDLPRIDVYYCQHPSLFSTIGTAPGRAYLRSRRFLREFRQAVLSKNPHGPVSGPDIAKNQAE